jgi:hypothetical protein
MHNMKTGKIKYESIIWNGVASAMPFYKFVFFIYACPKMRSAQTPFGVWAIMKKFIYMCNEKHYGLSRLLCD